MADPWSALPWESRARGGWASDDDDDDDKDYYEDVSKEDADAHFAKYLVFLKSAGHLTAKQACILAFWAMKGAQKGSWRQWLSNRMVITFRAPSTPPYDQNERREGGSSIGMTYWRRVIDGLTMH